MGIGVLGSLVVDDGGRLEPRDRAALAVLVVCPDQVVSPAQMADALWREQLPTSWRKQVQILIARLRRQLGTHTIETLPGGYRLRLSDDELDAARFEALVTQARALAVAGHAHRAVTALDRALSLWRGPALPELDDWPPARAEAFRLEELRRTAEEDRLEARLAAGQHREVAVEAETLVDVEPWRERRWAALALARYRCGRQGDALDALRTARRLLREEFGLDPGPKLVELEAALLRQDPSLLAPPMPSAAARCPYKGLTCYDEQDAEEFCGREQEARACLERVAERSVLVLAGASGSGKSSLLRAGLVPALRRRGLQVTLLPSGTSLIHADLAHLRPGCLLAVDQLEELFVLGVTDEEVARASAKLATAAASGVTVVVVVRSDHLGGLAGDPRLRRLIERGLHLVSPLAGDELRAAVQEPAHAAGLRLEEGLVDLLVRDCEGEPGGLPLLSHALVETWHRREGNILTVEAYRVTGGIRGAVARSADRLHDSLSPQDRIGLRNVLLRLVSLAPDGEPLRGRVPTTEFDRGSEQERLLALLVSARLVTAEDGTYQIAHEALARAWPRLRSWVDDDVAGLRMLRHLTAAAQGWAALDRSDSELYRGPRLESALEWCRATQPALSVVEREFLSVSAERSASEARALRARALADSRRARRLRAALSATALLLVVALAAGTVAVESAEQARARGADAAAAETRARLEALAGRSSSLRSTARDVAALLAVEAHRRRADARSWSALLAGFTAAPSFLGHVHLGSRSVAGAVVPGTSSGVLLHDGQRLELVDLTSGHVRRPLLTLRRAAHSEDLVRVSRDGRVAAVLTAECGGECASLRVIDLRSGAQVAGPLQVPLGDLAVSPDGSLVAVSSSAEGSVQVRRSTDGVVVATVEGDGPVAAGRTPFRRPAAAVAFDDEGTLHTFSAAGRLRSVEPSWSGTTRLVQLPDPGAGLHLEAAGELLVVGGPRGLAAVDRRTGSRRWVVDLREGLHPDPCPWLTVAPAPGRLYCGNHYGVIEERDLASGSRTGGVLDPQQGSVGELSVIGDGWELLAFGAESPVVSRWRLDGSGLVTRLVARGHVTADGYDPSGRTLLVARREQGPTSDDLHRYAVWDPERDMPLATIDDVEGLGWAGSSTLVGLDRRSETLRFWDQEGRPRPGVALPLDAFHLWPSAGGERMYAGFENGELWTIDVATRTRREPTLRVQGRPLSVSATAGGARVVVTAEVAGDPVTTVHDGRTGQLLAGPRHGADLTAVGRGGALVGASSGAVGRFDLRTLQPLATLAGARGQVSFLQWSDDERVVLAGSNDQTVSIYDAASGVRLGDPLPAASPLIYPASLRPDGAAAVVNGRYGLHVWSIDPDVLARAACRQAGRNLTEVEWRTHLSWAGERRATCPEHPL